MLWSNLVTISFYFDSLSVKKYVNLILALSLILYSFMKEFLTTYFPYLLGIAIIVLLLGLYWAYATQIWIFLTIYILKKGDEVEVIEVIEGDTILVKPLKNSTVEHWVVRLIGIDSPESKSSLYIEEAPFGKESCEYVQKRLSSQAKIRLVYDEELVDKFEKRLAYVFLTTGECLNKTLLQEGYAWLRKHAFRPKFEAEFEKLQAEAKRKNKNIWSMYVNRGVLREDYKNSEAYQRYRERITKNES